MASDSERGRPAGFDRRTGAVHGSGSGAGGGGNPDEDHDSDPQGGGGADPMGAPEPGTEPLGTGHPLPGSREARHGRIPEHAEREKGRGDDPRAVIQPAGEPVTPEGEAYRYDVDRAGRAARRPAPSGAPVEPGRDRRPDSKEDEDG